MFPFANLRQIWLPHLNTNPKLIVDIRADKRTPWDFVIAVFDACLRHGITQFSAKTAPARTQMTRLQKKCFLFSAGMHLLLGIILIGTSAFRDKPAAKDEQILTMIPSRILDEAGAGGGSPAPLPAPQPSQPAAPVVQADDARPRRYPNTATGHDAATG